MSTSYVYSLVDPRTDAPFYVGVTNDLDERFASHINGRGTNERLKAIIADLACANTSPQIKVLEEISDPSNRYDRERFWILSHIRQGIELCNVNGLYYRGRRLSEETITGKANHVTLTAKIRPDQLEALTRIARERGSNKSDVLRDMIDAALYPPTQGITP